ncbi:MAG: PEP-CTERM sorting domain-containing protein [Spirulina sp. SIO3F2]|nr:PEP-CTERM sorting domain-containing protein [Spirulina sp. SIO3F2]
MNVSGINLMLSGLVGAGAIALSSIALPAYADPINIDYTGTVEATFDVDDDFSALVNGFTGITLPDGPINESISGSITLDDDPAQYNDGDISLGYDFLSSVLGFSVSQDTLNALDSWLDLEAGGSGTLSNGITTMTYSLSYNSELNELVATFDNFDLDTEIISSCVTNECTWEGDFGFYTTGEEIDGQGVYNFVTNPGAGSPEAAPEPTSLLGMGLVLGFGVLAKKKRR